MNFWNILSLNINAKKALEIKIKVLPLQNCSSYRSIHTSDYFKHNQKKIIIFINLTAFVSKLIMFINKM